MNEARTDFTKMVELWAQAGVLRRAGGGNRWRGSEVLGVVWGALVLGAMAGYLAGLVRLFGPFVEVAR